MGHLVALHPSLAQTCAVRGISRVLGPFSARPRHPEPQSKTAPEGRGLHNRRWPGKQSVWQRIASSKSSAFASRFLATGEVCSGQAASGRVAVHPGGNPLLEFVPIRFDLYRTVRPALRWTLQCLVGFADKTGRCFPSVRKLAAVTGIGKSTVARHLSELVKALAITRRRRPGGGYSYQVDARFLPAARLTAGVSHQRNRAVPPARTEEN